MADATVATKPVRARVRMYQVGFGDCFLLSFEYASALEDGRSERHILIDFGSTRRPDEGGDPEEIASLIAPRPCLWEVGRKDALMVKEWIEPALERIRRAYRAYGATDALEVDSFDGGHRWNGVKAYPLLDRVLKLE